MTTQQLQEQFPETELVFFPGHRFEEALLGVASRPNTPVLPVYDFRECLKIAADHGGLSSLGSLLTNPECAPAPLVLMPIVRDLFWDDVRAGKLKVWEQMHDAIIGVGLRSGQRTTVYSQPKLMDELACLQQAATEELDRKVLEMTYEREIKAAWLGAQTPYIMTPILT